MMLEAWDLSFGDPFMGIALRGHSGGCVTLVLQVDNCQPVVLMSLRPWPGYLSESVY